MNLCVDCRSFTHFLTESTRCILHICIAINYFAGLGNRLSAIMHFLVQWKQFWAWCWWISSKLQFVGFLFLDLLFRFNSFTEITLWNSESFKKSILIILGLILSFLTFANKVILAHFNWLLTAFMLLECNNWQWLILTVYSHEIKESNRTCNRCLSYQTNFFTRSEKGAGHIFINMEINFSHVCHYVKLDHFVT